MGGCRAFRAALQVFLFALNRTKYPSYRESIFSRACCNRTRSTGFKLREGRFRLDVKKKFFTMRVVKPWHRLPGEVANALSLETLKARWMGL